MRKLFDFFIQNTTYFKRMKYFEIGVTFFKGKYLNVVQKCN